MYQQQHYYQPVMGNGSSLADDWSFLSRMALMGATSQGTMGVLVASGFLFKTIGWRVVAVTGECASSS